MVKNLARSTYWEKYLPSETEIFAWLKGVWFTTNGKKTVRIVCINFPAICKWMGRPRTAERLWSKSPRRRSPRKNAHKYVLYNLPVESVGLFFHSTADAKRNNSLVMIRGLWSLLWCVRLQNKSYGRKTLIVLYNTDCVVSLTRQSLY